ncbi:ketopantoate reductase family protein [Clostridium beijerinckii]|uniref:ketopantoate reductase family protein n=1 Tax=Clostridium beijerinckii TaxID=1520 RepID=UPI00080A313D|nr:ketopantoate reductase family protein [Clostridium beijerinckii]OCB01076.1 2-dehydropantoate 2-reductase [Clostridium beijerinckii]
MKVAILGAGSLGTIMGAVVSKNGGDCVLIDANKSHVERLNQNGATVTGYLDLKNIPVKAILPEEMEGIYDVVIVLLKQTANKAALTNLLPFLDENSIVCTLQNGIPEESVAEIVGKERTIGGTVGWGGGWISPGVAQLYTKPEFMRIEIGSLDGKVTEQVKKVESFLKLAGDVDINTNLAGIRWSKLLMNSALSGMSAALACTFGDIIDDDKAVACAAHVANELIKVSRSKGITLETIVPGFNFYELQFEDKAGRDNAITFLRKLYDVHRPQKASMLQDMEKSIPCEIDYINGIICQNGDTFGIDTPFNDEIVQIVQEFEANKIPFPTMINLDRFNVPELK